MGTDVAPGRARWFVMSTENLAVVALVDMMCAAADNLAIDLRRRDAERLATEALELLEVAGYTIEQEDS